MSLTYIENGNIFDSQREALVNPVNCVGVMGAGLAKQFKERFPIMFNYYKIRCDEGLVQIGRMDVHSDQKTNKIIINFPTKKHWKDPSKLTYIEMGLEDLKNYIIGYDIKSVALPKLGCGCGGLDWLDVHDLIQNFAKGSPDVVVEVYL